MREAIHCNTGALNRKKNNENNEMQFNFITYLRYIFAKIVFFICPNINWTKMRIIK
jgi:hypothetical protein